MSRRTVVGIATLLAVAGLWYLLTAATGWVGSARFPNPAEFGTAVKQIVTGGYAGARIHEHVLQSCKLVAMGFLVAVSVGLPLGLLMGWNRRAEALINPVFLIIRPIPPLAWIPLAIVWLGLGDGAKIMVIFFAAFVPSVINTHAGIRNIEPFLIEAARMLGVRGPRFVFGVLLPAAAPLIFTGLRLSLQASWTTLVAAELVGALLGLGYVLNAAAQDIFPAMILTGMVFVALSGAASTWLLGRLEQRVTRWRTA
ncbi:MAG: ABC transporter permease [Burkholderiales bacterium]|nr:ABC transporter permease [Burkholderiales bacterium]